MRLSHISIASIVACLGGLLLLIVMAFHMLDGIRGQQTQMQRLLELDQRVGALKVASTDLLLYYPEDDVKDAFEREARAVQQEFDALDGEHPGGSRVGRYIDLILGMLNVEHDLVVEGDPGMHGPLNLSRRSQILLGQMAGHGAALEGAVSVLLERREGAITRRVNWTVAVFAAVAVAFGALCVMAFMLLHRRLAGPVQLMSSVVHRLAHGDTQARVTLGRNDELSELGDRFNRLLDQQQETENDLRRYESEQREANDRIQEQQRLLDTAGRIARFGAWWVDVANDRVTWSDVACDIFGHPPGSEPDLEQVLSLYLESDRKEIERLYARAVNEGRSFDGEFNIINGRGEHRILRATGESVPDEYGEIRGVQGGVQDITDYRRSEQALSRISHQLRLTMDNIGEGFYTLDEQWRFTYVNRAALRTMSPVQGGFEGRRIWDVFSDLEASDLGLAFHQARDSGKPQILEEFFYPTLSAWFDIRVYPNDAGLAVIFADVTDRHQMLERLRQQEADLRHSSDQLSGALKTTRALIDSLPAHIALLDGSGGIAEVNEDWREFAKSNQLPHEHYGVGVNYITVCQEAARGGDEDAAIMERAVGQVLAGTLTKFSHEYPCHGPESERWFRVTVNPLHDSVDGDVDGGAVVMHLDITERKQAERYLNRLAFQDQLTQAMSRSGFTAELDRRLSGAGWDRNGIVVILDLINLRHVNDSNGFDVGDQLLQSVASRLLEAAGEGGVLGRAGGDEFMIYIPGNQSEGTVSRRERLQEVFRKPFHIGSFPIEMSARFGYTRLEDRPRAVEHLLRESELALFQGGDRHSPNRWSGYTAALDRETRERLQLTEELRQALEQDQFELHYQPKVDMRTGHIVAAEALIRWQHPERGMVSPGLFIPVAEQSQLIGPIGDWVMDAACRSLRGWREADLDVVPVSVNVSLEQFNIGQFQIKVDEVMNRNGISRSDLVLEITESVFEKEQEGVLEHLKALHQAGVRLSLDDFGTGYSSLLYLQKYPFNEIKIDRGFVNGMLNDNYSLEIVRTVIGIARVIGADLVAEGVETPEERDALLEMGCSVAQGFYYSKPLPESEFRALLVSGQALPIG